MFMSLRTALPPSAEVYLSVLVFGLRLCSDQLQLLITLSRSNMPSILTSSSPFPEPNARLIRIAEDLKPELTKTLMPALEVIESYKDEAATLGWTKKTAEKQLHELPPLTSGQHFIVDFGDHLVASYVS